jgi:hypothetical protein
VLDLNQAMRRVQHMLGHVTAAGVAAAFTGEPRRMMGSEPNESLERTVPIARPIPSGGAADW